MVTHILQCSELIINTKMSLTQELEFLGMLVNTNTLLVSLLMAEAIRISNMASLSVHLLFHFLGKLSTATQAIFPAPLFFYCLQRDSQQQQSGLRGSSVPITTHPRKTLLVERRPFQMEWEAPKGQVRSSYHQLRCLPTRLGVACVKNCTGGAR